MEGASLRRGKEDERFMLRGWSKGHEEVDRKKGATCSRKTYMVVRG
jgi:hypothetical protein